MHIAKEHGNEHLQRVVESLSHHESREHRGGLGDGKGQTPTPRSSITELVIQRVLTPDEVAENLRSTQLADDDRLQKAYDNRPAMRRGERGDAVKKVQQALVDDGFKMPGSTKKSGELDGIFGSETRSTVKAFQGKYLLDDDGVVGRQTLGKMDELYAGPSPLIPEDRKPEIEATEEEIGEHVTTGMDKANLGPHTADSGIHYAHNYRRNHPDLWKEDFEYGFANPAYFERIDFMDWRLKAGVSASEGIKAWLKGLTIAECLSAIYAIKSDAVRAALGDTKFDKIYGGTTKLVPKEKRLRISADPETASVDKLLKETEATEKGEIGTFGNRPAKKGEWYYFYNHPKYLLKHPGGAFQGENALYMGLEGGDQIWSGLGIDRVTELGMMEEMVKAYNLPRGEDDAKELARITADNGGTLPEKYSPASGIFPDQLSDAGEILSAPEYEIDDTKRKGGFVADSGYKLDIEKIKAMK
jgi:peptidoglycan hydrolase-like protein with peptidoglycan-binding domain